MAIDQRMLAEYLRRQQQQGMSLGRPPITMESQVNALANQPLAPGMVSAYVDESKPDPRAKSFAGEESRLKSQRAYADMLRGKEAPKGKTVGPYDLYMGPNWGESLAYAGQQALGGYMTGLANRDDKALDEEKGRVLAATLARQDEIEDRGFNLKLDEYNRGIYESDRDYKYQKVQDQIANDLNADSNRQSWAATEVPVFFDPTGESPPMSGIQTSNGVINPITREPVPEHFISQEAYADMSSDGTGGGTFNEPKRFIDPYTGEELMVSFHKGKGKYFDPVAQDWYTPEEMEGKIPEREMTESQREAAVANFIKNNGDTMKLMYDIQSAEQTWRSNGMEAGENPFNWFTKQTGVLGDVMRNIADIGEDGAPTADNYAAAQTTFNTISRLRAGLSQTVNEVERIREETGQNALANPEVMIKYWSRLRGKVENDIAMANKAASPRTIQAYQRWERNKGVGDVIGLDGEFSFPSDEGNVRGHGANPSTTKRGIEDYTEEDFLALPETDQVKLLNGERL